MILVGLPCFGRHKQTADNVARLWGNLGSPGRVLFVLAFTESDGDEILRHVPLTLAGKLEYVVTPHQLTYWQALEKIRQMYVPQAGDKLVGLANDLLPGHEWLERGLIAYGKRFGSEPAVVGFNDGIHGPEHSPHFIIAEELLARYGGWPVHYRHNYGDTEICLRAHKEGRYAKAPWAVLYHNHHLTGAPSDNVYQTGDKHWSTDLDEFCRRRRIYGI